MAETLINSDQQQEISSLKNDALVQKRKLLRVMGVVLSLVVIVLGVIVYQMQSTRINQLVNVVDMSFESNHQQAANYRTYVGLYQTTKQQLEETTKKLEEVNRQLDAVTVELNSTKALLAQTQSMLSQAQLENLGLKTEIQGIDAIQSQENVANVKELQVKINSLKNENVQVSNELESLKSQLKAFEADVANLQEGRSLIALFQNKIKLVKSRMKYLKQEAYFAKVNAQKEKDRVAMLNGNNGYLMRNGSSNNQSKSFSINVNLLQ